MKTFLELYSDINELKKVNIAQRKKMARRMKKMAQSSAFKLKVAKSKLRIASPEKLKVRAQKKAKEAIIKKYYPRYNELPLSQKVKIDQDIAVKYGKAIEKIALKQLPLLKKQEFAKIQQAKQAKQDA